MAPVAAGLPALAKHYDRGVSSLSTGASTSSGDYGDTSGPWADTRMLSVPVSLKVRRGNRLDPGRRGLQQFGQRDFGRVRKLGRFGKLGQLRIERVGWFGCGVERNCGRGTDLDGASANILFVATVTVRL